MLFYFSFSMTLLTWLLLEDSAHKQDTAMTAENNNNNTNNSNNRNNRKRTNKAFNLFLKRENMNLSPVQPIIILIYL